MDLKRFDMFLAFVIRNERFLKKRETSFTQKELDYWKKISTEIVRRVSKKLSSGFELKNDDSRNKLAREINKSFKKASLKQVMLIVENYDAFAEAVKEGKDQKPVKITFQEGDRYYAPVRR
jgi:hypothetical protein